MKKASTGSRVKSRASDEQLKGLVCTWLPRRSHRVRAMHTCCTTTAALQVPHPCCRSACSLKSELTILFMSLTCLSSLTDSYPLLMTLDSKPDDDERCARSLSVQNAHWLRQHTRLSLALRLIFAEMQFSDTYESSLPLPPKACAPLVPWCRGLQQLRKNLRTTFGREIHIHPNLRNVLHLVASQKNRAAGRRRRLDICSAYER